MFWAPPGQALPCNFGEQEEAYVRRLADDGLKAWQQVIEHGYEGLVAKDPALPYVGGRTLTWLKGEAAGLSD